MFAYLLLKKSMINLTMKSIMKIYKKTVHKDDILGELVIKCEDDVLYSCYLYAESTCKKKNFLDYIKKILNLWLYPLK